MQTQPPAQAIRWLAAVALLVPLLPGTQADAVSDPAGDVPLPYLDIVAVRAENDVASTLDLVVEVDDMTAAVPSNAFVTSYTLDFCTDSNLHLGQPVCWRLQGNDNNDVVNADFFRARVRALDGGYCTLAGLLAGAAFDHAASTVRWTVAKAALNVTAPPTSEAACATLARGGAPLSDGDVLSAIQASTSMSFQGTPFPVDATSAGTYTVNSPLNYAPEIVAPGPQSVPEGALLQFTATATDPDGDDVTFSSSDLPAGASLDASGAFSWTPSFDQEGDYTVTLVADDGNGASSSATVAITVTHTNQAPVLDAIADASAPRRTLMTFTVHATDPDGDTVTYVADGLPLGAALNPVSGEFSWVPGNSQEGQHTVTFRASDGSLEDAQTVVLTVTKH